jgi:dihydroorotase
MIELLSVNPARIFKLPGGGLKNGAVADITIFDPQRQIRVEVSKCESRSRNTPFDGWNLTGAPVATIVGGKIVWSA